MHKTFRALASASEFRRHHLSFVQTLDDLDLVREIGLHQAMGHPITLKALFLKGSGSVATIQRRLTRLKRLGVVAQERAGHDKRVRRLTLTPDICKVFARLGRHMRKIWA
jgi:DNA-binding MarR family transcriptional regulator